MNYNQPTCNQWLRRHSERLVGGRRRFGAEFATYFVDCFSTPSNQGFGMTQEIAKQNGRNCSILIIDDEEGFRRFIARNLTESGFDVTALADWTTGQKLLEQGTIEPSVVVLEPSSREHNCLDELESIKQILGSVPLLILSFERDPSAIVVAIQKGASDYLVKPVSMERLNESIFKLIESRGMGQVLPTRARPGPAVTVPFICQNSQMKRIRETLDQVAQSTVPILVHGESGVGKEVIARFLHEKSRVSHRPMVKVNCAALPSDLAENELFGHVRGAFTGAHSDRPGKFEFAHGATIFLDEIGEFSPGAQAKLLQVLQDGRFTRLGSNEEVEVDVRVLAATNRNLEREIEAKNFRADLYYRLNVVNIEIPPLRDRKDEIPLFCQHFLEKFGSPYKLDKEMLGCFMRYDWPGNVRELENLMRRYTVLGDAAEICSQVEQQIGRMTLKKTEIDLSLLDEMPTNGGLKKVAKEAAARVEKNLIVKTLCRTNWNKWQAAKELEVSYKTLLTRIDQYEITPQGA